MEEQNASARLIDALGDAFVKSDDSTLARYASSINGAFVKPSCIVFPDSPEAVVTVIRVARELKLELFPVSRGRNFGYGDAQGTRPGQVIVDLSRMNRITEVNDKMAYATIQPGVSQQHLYRHLRENHPGLQLDVTGAGLDASIMGNMLERGFGHTDYGNRFARIISLKVATPNGEILDTGFAGLEKADAAPVYRYGIGPVLDGLFSQSNFGIVVEMTFELMPVPDRTEMFVFSTGARDGIAGMVRAVRELKLNGLVHSAIHIANKARAVGKNKTRFAGAWNMSGSVSGPPGVVAARRRAVRTIIRRHTGRHKLWFVGRRMIRFIAWVHRHVRHIDVYDALREAYDLQTGIPTDHSLQTLLDDPALRSESLDPSQYNICFAWINAVCRADEESVTRLLGIMEPLFESHGYEFRVTFTAVNPRTLIMISNITFTRDDDQADKARAFTGLVAGQLSAAGFYPYRSGSGMHEKVPDFPGPYTGLVSAIKQALDPDGIIAPGKYKI